jgi:hypothetical protein
LASFSKTASVTLTFSALNRAHIASVHIYRSANVALRHFTAKPYALDIFPKFFGNLSHIYITTLSTIAPRLNMEV